MNEQMAKEILDKVVGQVFGYQNPFSLEQALAKFAFDRRLPQPVNDTKTGEKTWASSTAPSQFITMKNASLETMGKDFMIPTCPLNGVDDIIAAWAETNFTTTERTIDSLNVAQSDLCYGSENVFRSLNTTRSKNIIFSEGVSDSEYLVAGLQSTTSSFCVRVEDSQLTTNSFNVIWSAKVSNSFFIQDCYDCMDCMFCSHLSGKRFCVANMQLDETEYNRLKPLVIKWILTS